MASVDVVVVGGGAAGLDVANSLKAKGKSVLLLEQDARFGGRILTFRRELYREGEDLTSGLFGEAGAMRVLRRHARTIALTKKFNVPIQPYTEVNGNCYYYLRGNKGLLKDLSAATLVKCGVLSHEDIDLAELPRGMDSDLDDFTGLCFGPMLADFNEHGWEYVGKKYDHHTLYDFLKTFNATPRDAARGRLAWAVFELLFGTREKSVPRISCMHEFAHYLSLKASDNVFEVVGGFDQLVSSLVAGIKEEALLQRRVTHIEYTSDGATVTHVGPDGVAEQVKCRAVVVTAPFGLLHRGAITFSPDLPTWKQDMLAIQYSPALKIFLRFKERFWESEGIYGGITLTDLPLHSLHYPDKGHHHPNSSEGTLLCVYAIAADVEHWKALSEEERCRQALEQVAVVHGDHVKDLFLSGASQHWEFAYTLMRPGEFSRHEDVCRPVECLHWAGEHASANHAWIEGALDSSARVMDELAYIF
mmetsp:Transcript_46638/g.117479  ORF Transcript_46638/g.117479 Transcript_46638/m.117479 type:complete len:475 (+) Transcript_46638:18-1442(+)